jgi:hypothetical protein
MHRQTGVRVGERLGLLEPRVDVVVRCMGDKLPLPEDETMFIGSPASELREVIPDETQA